MSEHIRAALALAGIGLFAAIVALSDDSLSLLLAAGFGAALGVMVMGLATIARRSNGGDTDE